MRNIKGIIGKISILNALVFIDVILAKHFTLEINSEVMLLVFSVDFYKFLKSLFYDMPLILVPFTE